MHFSYNSETKVSGDQIYNYDTQASSMSQPDLVSALLDVEQIKHLQTVDGKSNELLQRIGGIDVDTLNDSLFRILIASFALSTTHITIFRITYPVDPEIPHLTFAYLNRQSWQSIIDLGMVAATDDPRTIYGKTLAQVGFSDATISELYPVIQQVVKGIPVVKEEFSRTVNDEAISKPGSVSITQTIPIFDGNGEVVYALATSRNIVDQTEVLSATALEALRVLREYGESQVVEDQNITIAHDGNGILAALMGNTEIARLRLEELIVENNLAQSEALDDLQYSLGKILESSKQMATLFKQIRELAKNTKKDYRVIDLPRKIKGVLDLEVRAGYLRFISQAYRGSIEIEIEEGFVIKALPLVVRMAMANLMSNAMDAIIEKIIHDNEFIGQGVLNISCRMDKDVGSVIEVNDNGIGMTPETIRQIFKPGFTTKTNKVDLAGGLGIGLDRIRSYIEMHGGDIKVESIFGVGTTFTISFPYSILPTEYEELLAA